MTEKKIQIGRVKLGHFCSALSALLCETKERRRGRGG